MTDQNAALANNTAHHKFEFGAFEERLAHVCKLFEIDAPEIEYENGSALLTEQLLDLANQHNVNLDWLFSGNPDGLLRSWADTYASRRELADCSQALEPEVQRGLSAMLKAVVEHDLPMKEAMDVFTEVVAEFRR